MCQGGQGNLQGGMRRPGFNTGGFNDPANGGFGYYGGGTSSWGGDYGNMGYAENGNPMYEQQGQNGYAQNQMGRFYEQDYYNNARNQGMNYNNTQDASTARGNQQETSTDPFAGIKAGRLAQAQRFANAGLFGRASQQIGLGGGNWDDVGDVMRQQAGETDNYGGDWNWGKASDADVAQAQRFADAGMMGKARGLMGDNWSDGMEGQFRGLAKANPYEKGTSMGFDWGDVGAGRLAKAKEFAAAGKMGQARNVFETGKKGGKWNPNVHAQFKAWAKGNK